MEKKPVELADADSLKETVMEVLVMCLLENRDRISGSKKQGDFYG